MRKTSTPLRNLRRARTMTQAEFARLVGVTQGTLSRYERGDLVPPRDIRAVMATILGASEAELFPQPESVAS